MEVTSCKYLGIMLHRDLNCVHQVNYTVPKVWKALHFIMSVLTNGIIRKVQPTSVARPILKCGASCWETYMKGQINALDRVQKKRINLQIITTIRAGKTRRSGET